MKYLVDLAIEDCKDVPADYRKIAIVDYIRDNALTRQEADEAENLFLEKYNV